MRYGIILFILLSTLNLNAEIRILNKNFPLTDELKDITKTETDIQKIKTKIEKYLIYKGYKLTGVEYITKKSDNTFIVFLNEGRLKDIRITGNFKISKNLLNVYLKMKPGDIFNEKELKLQLKKLYNTGLFDKINYKIYPDKRMLVIKIKEKKKRYFKFSGNMSSKYGVMPFVQYIDRDIFNTGTYLTLSTELGIWEKLKFQKYGITYGIKSFNLFYLYRNGIMYMADKDYKEEKSLLYLNKLWSKGKYLLIGLKGFIESHYFYQTGKIESKNIVQGLRYGISLTYYKSNKRDVIEKIKENVLNISTTIKAFSNTGIINILEFYYKRYFSPIIYWGIIYRNCSSYIYGNNIPFDEKFPIGGEMQRGFYNGEYWSPLKFENSLELEYELLIDRLFISAFCDTSLIKPDKDFLFLISFGNGIRLNFWGFTLSLYYGVPITRRIIEGEFYFKLTRIF